ncbi:MAG: ABC transporter permease [Cyclobacteriaceae bacterium]|nr:ABC transporter permease [Cyclobacteriaceae bacterium]
MLSNYFKTALRIMLRQKAYSAINIFGLTLGITSSLLLILYISDELRYDRFHPDADRIYRSTFTGSIQGNEFTTIQTGIPMAEALMKDVPAVESTVRISKWNTIPVRYETNIFTEKHFLLADSNFFDFFKGFKLLVGNPKEVLNGPHKVVISERAAKKYFGYTGSGDLSPLGKQLSIGSRGEMKAEVTGIAADPPHSSHIQFDFLYSLSSWDQLQYAIWLNSSVVTYFKIHPQAKIETVNNAYRHFIETYCAREIQQFMNMDLKKFEEGGGKIGFQTQAFTDIHLHSQIQDELEPNGNIRYLYLFGMIAAFIILLACINFMNLSTARAANRAKEVGVRKTIGGMRSRLVGQFLLESYIYTVVAVVLGLAFVSLALNSFNVITGKDIAFNALVNPVFMVGILTFALVVGLVAGSYPAFYLTSFNPVEVLKGKVRSGMKSSGIRNALVVFQFFISIGLIVATLMVYQQLKFVQQQNLGFNKENILNLYHTWSLSKDAKAFKNELLQHPEIIAATYANRLPPNIDWSSVFKAVESSEEQLLSIHVIDHDAAKTMGYEIQEGRFFSRDFPTDTAAFLLNEAAAKQLGWEKAEGQKLLSRFNTIEGRELQLIGIVKNFNFESLKNNIRPMVFVLGEEPNAEMGIRIAGNNVLESVTLIEKIWKKYAPESPFEYTFVDDNFKAKFDAEQRMGQVFIIFTSLAIIIACLGLFGLATFSAEQRAKEISIRKIMGANIAQVVLLLTKDFARLVFIAFVLAIPITWFSIERLWLQDFAYRIQFNVGAASLAGIIAFTIALLTILSQALQAAVSNPVKSLRNE